MAGDLWVFAKADWVGHMSDTQTNWVTASQDYPCTLKWWLTPLQHYHWRGCFSLDILVANGEQPYPSALTHLLGILKKTNNTLPTHWALNLHHCESNGKSGVTLLPERWGQQSNFFSKFLGWDSKAELMELFQWQPPNSSNSRPLIIFLLKKMAVTQAWLRFCTNMSFPLAFLKKRWNRIWTNGVATGLPQGKSCSSHGCFPCFSTHVDRLPQQTRSYLQMFQFPDVSVPSTRVLGGLGLEQVGFWASLFSWSL